MAVWKEPADVATTEDLGAGPAFPVLGKIDGVILKVGDRVLVKDQLTPAENGYYEVAAGVPPTLVATGDTIDAEDVIRVNQGDKNAHTAWALIDAANRIFVRQDVKHYSLKSIDALKHLWQVLPNATATVASYYAPGDMGGGDFTLIGVPTSAQVASANPVSTPINTVTDVDGLVTITAVAHDLGNLDNVTTTYISGVTGLLDKAYLVTVVNTDTFTINARISGASFAVGAKIQYVKLVTAAAHGRATGQRISVGGVVPSDAAADIRGVTDLSGVIDATTLSIPIATTGGTYFPGSHAVIGDDGLAVPATDQKGAYGGLWERLRVGHFDVKWFGAKADGTDDLPAFVAALGAMKAGGNKTNKLVADGHFFLSDTLVLTQTILLEGTGQNASPLPRVQPLDARHDARVPEERDGHPHSGGSRLDNPTKTVGPLFPPSGEQSILRNLTVYCKDIDARAEAKECRDREEPCMPEGDCIHGIHASAPVRLENLTVAYFAHDGIHIVGAECGKDVLGELDGNGKPVRGYDGNADGSYVENCKAELCGRDGFHFSGGDANMCLVIRCTAIVNGGVGYYDASFGNAYVMCHGEGNALMNYKTELDINRSSFLGCYSEDGPLNNLRGQPSILAGSISGHQLTPDSSAFILSWGIATHAPIIYRNIRGARGITTTIGGAPSTAVMSALSWSTLNDLGLDSIDTSSLIYLGDAKPWWALQDNGFHNQVIRFPTLQAHARQPAPWCMNGIFLGVDLPAGESINFTSGTSPPSTQYSTLPLTYELGDVVWQSQPVAGGALGQVCIHSGTQSTLNGGATTGSITNGTTELTVSASTALEIGQYITIAGVSGVKKIVALAGLKVTIDTVAVVVAGAAVADAPVAFSHATFATFGKVDSPSTSYAVNTLLALADRYVTVTADGKIMTLPASPVDGQTHSIKSSASAAPPVTTTVTGGVLTIDGQASVTLAPGGNGTFRYSAATLQWELR